MVVEVEVRKMDEYQYEATTREGFVQQIAVSYVRHGYYFFVQGRVPDGKDPRQLDRKILKRYDFALSKGKRFRRKERGESNLQYIRFGQQWVMLATKGEHQWFTDEASNVRDCRREPLLVQGYEISVVPGGSVLNRLKENPEGPKERDQKQRVRVKISKRSYEDLRAELLDKSRRRRADWYAMRFWNIGFEPYAPVRKQLLQLLRLVNAQRAARGIQKISPNIIRYKRRIVKPFEAVDVPKDVAA